jgi:3-oxoadipate enol-lactonase
MPDRLQHVVTGVATMNDGCKIAYSHYLNDDKPSLVLSNSLGTTQKMWDGQIAAFSQHFNLVTYDKRGHGNSDVFPGAYSLDRLGNDVVELLDLLGLQKVNFCGVSIGGMTAQWLATFKPERIERLIVANSAAVIQPSSMWQDRILHVQKHGLASIWDGVLARWVSEQFVGQELTTVKSMQDMFESIHAAGYASCCAAIRDMDMRNVACLNQLKTLIIAGTQDLATPVSESEFLLSKYRNATLVKLDAGHLSNVEQAKYFNEHVLRFLQSTE